MSTDPCTLCGDPGGRTARGKDYPIRSRGLCAKCDDRVRDRMSYRGLTYAEALAIYGGTSIYPEPLPGCRPYRHPEIPAPVPVLWATRGYQERWERDEEASA